LTISTAAKKAHLAAFNRANQAANLRRIAAKKITDKAATLKNPKGASIGLLQSVIANFGGVTVTRTIGRCGGRGGCRRVPVTSSFLVNQLNSLKNALAGKIQTRDQAIAEAERLESERQLAIIKKREDAENAIARTRSLEIARREQTEALFKAKQLERLGSLAIARELQTNQEALAAQEAKPELGKLLLVAGALLVL